MHPTVEAYVVAASPAHEPHTARAERGENMVDSEKQRGIRRQGTVGQILE